MRMVSEESLSSSEARSAILSRNEELRILAVETMDVIERASWSERGGEPLCERAKDLCAAAAQHMEFEERLLATALGDVIGWGPALRSQIEEDHERQRAGIVLAMAALGPHDYSKDRAIARLRSLAAALLVDLEMEERCLLTAEVDALSNDSHGG